MPRFQVTAEFDLTTEIEPELSRYAFDSSDAEEFEDSSYFQREDVRSSGGSLSFVVTADSEEEAEEKANEVISEGNEIEDDAGFTWVADNVSIEVEKIVPPMTLERAREILTSFAGNADDDEIGEAVGFVFDHILSLGTRLEEANQRIAGLVTRVEQAEQTTDWQALAQDILDGNREALLARLPEPHRSILANREEES